MGAETEGIQTNMKVKMKKKDFILFFALFAFLEPWWMITVPVLDFVFNLCKAAVGGWILYDGWKRQFKANWLLLFFALFRVLVVVRTIWCGSNEWPGYLMETLQWGVMILFLIRTAEVRKEELLRMVTFTFAVILALNILTWTPDGLLLDPGKGYFLLGIRTRIGDAAIPAMGLVLFEMKMYGASKNLKRKATVIFASSILFFVFEWVATGLISTLLLVAGYYIVEKFPNSRQLKWFIVFAAVLTMIGVVLFQIQEVFAWLITGIFQKDVSLTGRTGIWKTAIEIIGENKWLGVGYTNHGVFVPLENLITSGHSQLIQTLYYGGIVGTGIYFLMILYPVMKTISNRDKRMNILLVTVAVIIIESISEICMDTIYFLVLLTIMSLSQSFKEEKSDGYKNKKKFRISTRIEDKT